MVAMNYIHILHTVISATVNCQLLTTSTECIENYISTTVNCKLITTQVFLIHTRGNLIKNRTEQRNCKIKLRNDRDCKPTTSGVPVNIECLDFDVLSLNRGVTFKALRTFGGDCQFGVGSWDTCIAEF
jgi:hypothetical protein